VVYRWPCLALAAVCSSHNTPPVGAAYFLVVVTVVVDRGCNPLRTLLASLLTTLGALLGILDSDVRHCLLVALGVASLLLGAWRSSAVLLLVAY
jgi:hypothetical protein